MRFCQRNPKPCPLVGVSDTGDPLFRTLGDDVDVRTDLPRYRVFYNGVLSGEPTDITELWRSDLVAFAIGCSFTFEHALIAAGIPMRHIECDVTVPMFRSNLACRPAGPFSGNMVVSMRPIPADRIDEVTAICQRFPSAHGTPIHVGAPAQIGITDIAQPDYGEPVNIKPGEVPTFWGCGVTPQNVVLAARPELCITHAPGHMLITDVAENADEPFTQPYAAAA